MAKKVKLSKIGEEVLSKLLADAHFYQSDIINYSPLINELGRDLPTVFQSHQELTSDDKEKIKSSLISRAKKDLQNYAKIVKEKDFSDASKSSDTLDYKEIDNITTSGEGAIRFIYTYGDKLEAKKLAKEMDKAYSEGISHVYRNWVTNFNSAAGMGKRLRKHELKKKKKNLEQRFPLIILLLSFGAGLIFLSPNLTGNAIANLTTKTSSIIGVGLFIVGIVGSYFWFRKK
jgi:hypothetical protein